MSKNIKQVYDANPITSNAAADLMYFGQSPYGIGDDAAMTFLNFSAQFSTSSLPNSQIFVGNGSNIATAVPVSGDISLINTGAMTIVNNAVTYAKFQQVAAESLVGNPTNALANASAITASGNDQVMRSLSGTIGFGSIDLSKSNTVGSSILGIANGGTNQSAFAAPVGGISPIIYYNGTSQTSTNKFGFDPTFDILKIVSNLDNPQLNVSTSTSGSSNSASLSLSRGDSANGGAFTYYMTTSTTQWQNGMFSGSNDYIFKAISGFTGNVLTLNNTTGHVTVNSSLMTIINSASLPSAPTASTQLNISSSVQLRASIVLSGQEYFQAANTSTEGLALLIGTNRSNNRQLWMGDSLRLNQNTTNPIIRFQIPANGSPVVIDSQATNGSTQLPISFGGSGANTTITGNTITVAGGNASVTGGNLSVTAGDFNVTRSSTGAVTGLVSNTNNSSGTANAQLRATVNGASSGDPIAIFTVSGIQDWSIGPDNSNSQRFVIAATDTPGGSDRLRITTAGDITNVSGDFIINTVNKGITIKSAAVSGGTANAAFVTSVTLVGGTVTVNNSYVTSSCTGTIAVVTAGGTPGTGYRLNVGTGAFTVTSSSALDTSTLAIAFFKGN